jgi:hypothetical protein
MHEEKSTPRFVACKRRNVAAAYQRFLGPSAGALEEPWHSRTWSGLKRMLVRRKRAPLAEVRLAEVSLKESAS